MSTAIPLCHLSIFVRDVVDEHGAREELDGQKCIGSRCSAWSPNRLGGDRGYGSCGLTNTGRVWADSTPPELPLKAKRA